MESGTHTIENNWVDFARMHTHYFWRENIAFSRIPGCGCDDLLKTLYEVNGVIDGSTAVSDLAGFTAFCDSLKAAILCSKRFAIIQHPTFRLARLPWALIHNYDNCAAVWKEKTGIDPLTLSLRVITSNLTTNNDLLLSNHWWIPQEYCLLFSISSYDRIFKYGRIDDLAWWLGEQGIQLVRSSPIDAWEPNLEEVGDRSPIADKPLLELYTEVKNCQIAPASFVDLAICEQSQKLYGLDHALYNIL